MRYLLAFWAVVACAQTTYNKDISRLMQGKCQQCHQPNAVAPMSLLTYDDTVTSADDITRVLTAKTMPPWKPIDGFGTFRNSYGLNDAERQMFLDWLQNGMPQGDPADAPAPIPVQDSPWQLGTPDLTLQMPKFTPPRTADTYRCFVLDTRLKQSMWINASQALPGNAAEVHHVLLFLDDTGESIALDGKDGQPGYDCFGGPGFTGNNAIQAAFGGMVGAWVPGARVSRLDPGIGQLIPANKRIVMQVHYHPNGHPVEDQTSVGFYFAPEGSVKHRMLTLPLVNMKFKIPANVADYQVEASFQVPFFVSGKAILVAPHMHLLGRKIAVNITNPDNSITPLIRIDDWDFNWQGFYTLDKAISVAPNSVLRLTTTYDNTDQNPKNPNYPIKPVGWGEGTNDEMCLAFIGIILDNEGLVSLLLK